MAYREGSPAVALPAPRQKRQTRQTALVDRRAQSSNAVEGGRKRLIVRGSSGRVSPAKRRVLHFASAVPRVEGAGADARWSAPRAEGILSERGPRREHRAAALCRGVLQLIRAAPRAEGTLSAPASPAKTRSAAAYPRSAKGRRYSCACQPAACRVLLLVGAQALQGGARRDLEGAAPEPAFQDALEKAAQLLERRFFVGSHSHGREHRVAEKTPCRGVLQLLRAAPRAEGALSAPVSLPGTVSQRKHRRLSAQRKGRKVHCLRLSA